MADQNPPELQGRLDNFQNRNAKKPTSRIGVGALAAGLGLGGAALAYVFASSLQDAADPLQTSDVETFQDQRTGNGGRLEFPADEEDQRVEDALIAVEEALEPQVAEPVPAPAPDETVLRELAALREALDSFHALLPAERVCKVFVVERRERPVEAHRRCTAALH